MIYAILDVETSGLSPEKDEIFDISCLCCNSKLEKIFSVNHKIIVKDHSLIDKNVNENKALKFYSKELWQKEGVPIEIALSRISTLISNQGEEKCVPVGYNVGFDISFIDAACKKYNIRYPFSHLKLDMLSVMLYLNMSEPLKRYDLESISTKYKIKHENAHTAMADVMVLYDLLKQLKGEKKQKNMDLFGQTVV